MRIIAPASPFDRTLFYRGIGWLSQRFRVEVAEGTLSRSGFLAGSDRARRRALDEALTAPDVRAVIAARGGYGAGRITPLANWRALRRSPKWLVGFSDVTAIHLEAQRMHICSLHGENAAGLGRGDDKARLQWLDALENPQRQRVFDQLTVLRAGRAEGILMGGNLTVLFTAQAAGRLRLPHDTVLMLEDVTEASYRVDRMLSALINAGALDTVAALALGDFTDCSPGVHRVEVRDVLSERLSQLGVPIVAGLPCGHGRRNAPLLFGARACVDGTAGTLSIG